MLEDLQNDAVGQVAPVRWWRQCKVGLVSFSWFLMVGEDGPFGVENRPSTFHFDASEVSVR